MSKYKVYHHSAGFRFLFFIHIMLVMMKPGMMNAQQITFAKTFGNSAYNQGVASFQLSDSGFFVVGNSAGFAGTTAPYLARIDKHGNLLRDFSLSRPFLTSAKGAVMHDSMLYLAGFAYSQGSYDYMLMKIDQNGNVLMEQYWGTFGWDFGNAIVLDDQKNIYIAGESTDTVFGVMNATVTCLDSTGGLLWEKRFGGSNYDAFYAIDRGHGNTLIMAGTTASFSPQGDSAFYMVCTDIHGNKLWESIIDEPGTDIVYAVHPDFQYGYILCGETTSPVAAYGQDAVILATDTLGGFLWKTLLGMEDNDAFHNVVQLPDSTYRMAGFNSGPYSYGMKDFYFQNGTKYGTWGGQQAGYITIGGQKNDIAYNLITTLDSGFLLTGTTHSFGYGISNIFLLKLGALAQFSPYSGHQTDIREVHQETSAQTVIFPNPAREALYIKPARTAADHAVGYISDISGRMIRFLDPNLFAEPTVKVVIDDLPEGLYILRIGNEAHKFIRIQ
jgi:hypothetical protein